MGRLYKRGRVWWCWYVNSQGERVYQTTKCTDRRAAELTAARLEREAADPRHRSANSVALEGALDKLVADRESRGRAPGTVDMYSTKGSHLRRVLGAATPLAHIDAKAVDSYIATRLAEKAARTTIARELTTLRGALRLAARRGELLQDVGAIMPVGWASEYKPRSRALASPQELATLTEALHPHRAAHVKFIVGTGVRWAESVRARRGDVDLDKGLVYVRGTKTELSAGTVPIVGWMKPLVRSALKVAGEDLLFPPWVNVIRDLKLACARAGLEKVTPNDLRRTTATWLRAAGVEPSLIAGVLRHTDSRMVERVYGRIDPQSLGQLVAKRLCSTSVVRPSGKGGRGASSAKRKLPKKR